MKESNFHTNAGQANQTIQIKENAMSELSNLHSNRTMSSREIAELTGKEHKNVIADIRHVIETLSDTEEITGLKFQLSGYRDASGKSNPEYHLDFDATMTLLIRYGMTYDAAKESLSKRGFKEKAVMENLPMNRSMNLGMNKTMSSREIAELTRKQHKHVLEDIRSLINQGAISEPDFRLAEYTDAQGKPRPEYFLDFDATMTLLIRYGMTYNAAKESLSKRGFKEKAVMENLPMNRSMNLGMNRIMSSREIAELTRKQHKHVLEDIRSLINQGAITEPDFRLSEYRDVSGKSNPEYLLNFDATMTLVTGYNAVLRAKVIRRWRELEEGTAQPVSQLRNLSDRELEAKDLEAKLGIFKTLCEAAKLFGLEGNQALLKADKSLKKDYGDSFITRLEIELKSPDNEALLIATEIGKKLDPPISAKNVNLHLAAMGFQERVEYRTGKFEWRLTEKGKAYGSYLDTGKVHSNGTPIQQIKWKESIFPLVQKYLISLAH